MKTISTADTHGTKFSGHTGATVKRRGSDRPVLHVLRRARSGLKGRKERTRRDGVDADALGSEVKCERARVRDDGALGGRVVGQLGRALEGCHARGVDDAVAALEVGNGEPGCQGVEAGWGGSLLGDGEHTQDVAAVGALDVLELFVSFEADGTGRLTLISSYFSVMICFEALLTRMLR